MGRRHQVEAPSQRPACLECGGVTRLVPVMEAFPFLTARPRSPFAWLCECGAAVSCAPKGVTPMGYAAGQAAAKARVAGHHLLDRCIEAGAFGTPTARGVKTRAYAWLSAELGGPRFHFGEADLAACERACVLLRARLTIAERGL